MHIQTPRFRLRDLQPEDASERYAAWLNDPDNAFISSTDKHHSEAHIRDYIGEKSNDPNVLFLGIFDAAGGRHIGNIKFEPIDEVQRYAVLGILIGEADWRGKGVTPEVSKAAIQALARMRKIDRVLLGVNLNNHGAVKAYTKSGFKFEARPELTFTNGSKVMSFDVCGLPNAP